MCIELLLQIGWCIQCVNSSVYHDGNAVAIFCFIHIMRGYKNRHAAIRCVIDHFPKLPPCYGINAACRFIEEYNGRFMKNGDRK